MTCKFGEQIASALLESSTILRCSAPPSIHLTRSVLIHLSDEHGAWSQPKHAEFEYYQPISVRHVAPTMVSSAGGDRMTVFGSDFDSVKTIFLAFGRRTIVDTMRITSSLLRATAPAMDVGRKTIAVGGNRFDWEKHNENNNFRGRGIRF